MRKKQSPHFPSGTSFFDDRYLNLPKNKTIMTKIIKKPTHHITKRKIGIDSTHFSTIISHTYPTHWGLKKKGKFPFF